MHPVPETTSQAQRAGSIFSELQWCSFDAFKEKRRLTLFLPCFSLEKKESEGGLVDTGRGLGGPPAPSPLSVLFQRSGSEKQTLYLSQAAQREKTWRNTKRRRERGVKMDQFKGKLRGPGTQVPGTCLPPALGDKSLNRRQPRVTSAEEGPQAGMGGDLRLQDSELKAGLKATSGCVFQHVESWERSGPARTI